MGGSAYVSVRVRISGRGLEVGKGESDVVGNGETKWRDFLRGSEMMV